MAAITVTYYLEVLSSWCHWAEPAWAELKRRYAGRVEFEWKIALMNRGDFPSSREQCDWFYRRSGGMVMRSPYMLNSGWFDPRRADYHAPNLAAEAARTLGASGDTVRLALANAAVLQGRRIAELDESIQVAAKSGRLDARKLLAAARSKAVAAAVAASTADFHAHQITQRPAFVVADAIGDKAVFSGLVRLEPIAAAIDAMLADVAAYAAHQAHHGPPPPR